MLEPIVKSIEVPCGQERAFTVFVHEMPRWWPLGVRAMSMMEGEAARGLAVDPRAGGRIVETSVAGKEHHWGTITAYEPFERMVMDFHMGMPPENASVVTVTFTALAPDRTRVRLEQGNWEAMGDMAEMLFNGYNASWGMLFEEAYGAACGLAVAPAAADESCYDTPSAR